MKKIFAILSLLFVYATAEDASISKKQMYNRARDVLQEALEQKDSAKASTALEYLQANVSNGAPLLRFEEYLINMEIGNFEEGIRIYTNERRLLLDSAYNPKLEPRAMEKDGLSLHLYKDLTPFNKTKADSLIARVDSSDIPQESKDLYAALVYNELIVGLVQYRDQNHHFAFLKIQDTTAAEDFLIRAKRYIEKAPDVPETKFLADNTIPFIQNYMDKQREFRVNPLKHKYYQGGIGAYVSKWWGGISGNVTDNIQMDMGSVMFDIEIQYLRFNLGFFYALGIEAKKKYNDEKSPWDNRDDYENGFSGGLTAGVDVYDSRFLKVVPFIGVGYTTAEALGMDAKSHFLFGTNVDLRLFSTTPAHFGAFALAFHLRLKYTAKICSYKDTYYTEINPNAPSYNERFQEHIVSSDFVNHTFSIGLGIFQW